MAPSAKVRGPRVAVIGAGLAGLAAAWRLHEAGLAVELFEARQRPGGRAASFRDPATGQLVDHCQHVGLACCTNLIDFHRRTGLEPYFQRRLWWNFVSESGQEYRLAAARGWPAPLHLLPSLWRWKFFTWSERWNLGRTIVRLARIDPEQRDLDALRLLDWLQSVRAAPRTIRNFWALVVESALGTSLAEAALRPARQVVLQGFCQHRQAHQMLVPTEPLSWLYGQWIIDRCGQLQLPIHLAAPVTKIEGRSEGTLRLELGTNTVREFETVVLAVTWRHAAELLGADLRSILPGCEQWRQLDSSPISGVHLWFDRAITSLDHAVLVGQQGQWLFAPRWAPGEEQLQSHYYQVVISASAQLTARPKEELIERLVQELRQLFPAARQAQLLQARVVTEPHAVLAAKPGWARQRPGQKTAVRNLFLAGDWTETGWPCTLEGAVRSGYLAAEGVLEHLGRPAKLLVPDLPVARLARWLGPGGI